MIMKWKKYLSKGTKFLLLIGMLYLAGTNIAMTFVNVYLIRITDNIGLIIMQNILNYIALLGAFICGTKLISKINLKTILRIGVFSTAIYYLSILLLQENTAMFLIPLGVFNGIGQGLYYFSFNLLVGQVVNEAEQGKFFSFQQTFSYLFGVIVPIISGYIITQFTELTGYYLLFSMSVLLFILGAIMIKEIPGFKLKQEINVSEVLKVKNNVYWDTNKYYNFSNGIREAIFNQIFIVFAFSILNNEQTIGKYSSLMAFIGVLSATFIASRFNRENQKQFHLVGACVLLLAFLFLGISKSSLSLLFAYICLGLIHCWNKTIFQSMKYQLSSRAKGGYLQYDYIVASEFPVALGRIIGLMFALILCSVMELITAYRLLIIFVGIISLIDYYIINKKVNWLQGK
jgi:Major Facilitator Superfamily.